MPRESLLVAMKQSLEEFRQRDNEKVNLKITKKIHEKDPGLKTMYKEAVATLLYQNPSLVGRVLGTEPEQLSVASP